MRQVEDSWTVVVVGAGAAGLTAAIFAARAGARALLLETRPTPGAKIRVSGGGRCNVLPATARLADFHTSGSEKRLRNILFSWPLGNVRAFFERELRIPLKEEPPGKVFPVSDRSRDVVEALLGEARRVGVVLRSGRRVVDVEPTEATAEGGDRRATRFRVACASGEWVFARRVVLATGGLSLPKTGSDGFGLELAGRLGHTVHSTLPALTPLCTSDPAWRELAGISLPARLRVVEGEREPRTIAEREGDFLFTHRGFSGPVALDVSRYFSESPGSRRGPGSGDEPRRLLVGWGAAGDPRWEALLTRPGKRSVGAVLRERLPRRLVRRLLALSDVGEGRVTSELPRRERQRLVSYLESTPLAVDGTEGYRVAEVTAGGVPLEEVRSRTLESRRIPGLHFSGEMLDVDGRIGGYNFLWAWVTGKKAGEGAAGAVREQA